MTWRKTGTEFDDDCANVGLSDAAYRTHMEAIGFVFRIEAESCRFAKTAARRCLTSTNVAAAIQELLDHGFWADLGTHYEIRHHGDVIRDSLHAQSLKRDRDRKAQKKAREKKESEDGISADVSADTRQTDRQTNKHLEGDQTLTCKHEFRPGAWISPLKQEAACPACQEERKSA